MHFKNFLHFLPPYLRYMCNPPQTKSLSLEGEVLCVAYHVLSQFVLNFTLLGKIGIYQINPLTPIGPYGGCTTPLTSKVAFIYLFNKYRY